ncbi:hypothetical protein ACVI3U_002879 [Sinorhizobium medicae]|nr:hypothetical protein [Sinorhizobium meliloti]
MANIAVIFPGFLPYDQAMELDLSALARWHERAKQYAPKKGS